MASAPSAPSVSEPFLLPAPLQPVNRRHLDLLTTELGVWQHATLSSPDPAHGFCTDDVSRALSVDMLHARELGWPAVAASVRQRLTFLERAAGPTARRFRNFRSADGAWLEDEGSEDAHGRAMQSLAEVIAGSPDPAIRDVARRLYLRAVPAAHTMQCPRPISEALLACDRAIEAGVGADSDWSFGLLAGRLVDITKPSWSSDDWPWPEESLTYENALLPHALIVAGRRLGDAALIRGGCRMLDWLITVQTSRAGYFSPIGNKGWWPRGGVKSKFDQQAIEGMAMVMACETAYSVTGEARYRRGAEMAYGWFLGANDVGVPVAVPRSGACYDGLTKKGVNANQGAESTLAWLTALEHIRSLRAAGSSAAGAGSFASAGSSRSSARSASGSRS
jgi:hypothetical protein